MPSLWKTKWILCQTCRFLTNGVCSQDTFHLQVQRKLYITCSYRVKEIQPKILWSSGSMVVLAAPPCLVLLKNMDLTTSKTVIRPSPKVTTLGTEKQTCFTLNNQLVSATPIVIRSEHPKIASSMMTPTLQTTSLLYLDGTRSTQSTKATSCTFQENHTLVSTFLTR